MLKSLGILQLIAYFDWAIQEQKHLIRNDCYGGNTFQYRSPSPPIVVGFIADDSITVPYTSEAHTFVFAIEIAENRAYF